MLSRKQEQHLQMSWGERVWCAHGIHKGTRVAGSGEWGWNGGRVGCVTVQVSCRGCVCVCVCVCSKSLQLCLTLWNPVDCSLPDSSVHGILQARVLEQVAISYSRGASRPRD